MPPTTKNRSAAAPYMMPMRLWSTVVTQLRHPVVSLARVKTPRGFRGAPFPELRASWASVEDMSSLLLQRGEEGDQVVDLVFGQVEVRHTTALGTHCLTRRHVVHRRRVSE